MITLRLTAELDSPLDLSGVTPDAIAALSVERLRRLKVPYARAAVALGELFTLRGTPDTAVCVTGLTPLVHGVGAGMRSGVLHIEGHCGDQVGSEMRGGEIRLAGSARDRLGSGMRGGVILVEGSAGDFVGAGTPGATTGMKGGTIVISRRAGARAGDRMRRGTLVIGGAAGPGCASQMIAGTVVALGSVGADYALGMRRGSLLMRAAAFAAPETFVKTGEYGLSFITLLAGYLAQLKPALATRLRAFRRVERWVGDRGCDGLGEILVAKS